MKLTFKILLLLISSNFVNMQAMNHDKSDTTKKDHQVSSLCGDEIKEGGPGTYPQSIEEELQWRAVRWDREHPSVSWKAIFCSCFSSKNRK